jgi:transcriptional regulator with XRE-family HTH domain
VLIKYFKELEATFIGQKLREAMDKSGLSRKEIARKAGISEPGLYKIIKAKDIKVNTLIKLSNVLDVSIKEFLDIKDFEGKKELTQQLEKEKRRFMMSMGTVRNLADANQQLLELITIIEENTQSKEAVTLMLSEDIKRIPLSEFYKLAYEFFTKALSYSKNKAEIYKLINVLFNIIEFRQLIYQKSDKDYYIRRNMQKILQDISIIPGKEDEYIDFRQLLK